MAYKKTKRDGNHAEIVATLRKAGASVLDLAAVGGGAPDLLVGYRGANFLIEIKDPSQRGAGLEDNQVAWHRDWRGAKPAVAWTAETALIVIGAMPVRMHGHGIDGGDA